MRVHDHVRADAVVAEWHVLLLHDQPRHSFLTVPTEGDYSSPCAVLQSPITPVTHHHASPPSPITPGPHHHTSPPAPITTHHPRHYTSPPAPITTHHPQPAFFAFLDFTIFKLAFFAFLDFIKIFEPAFFDFTIFELAFFDYRFSRFSIL